jgi:hypothetical protein
MREPLPCRKRRAWYELWLVTAVGNLWVGYVVAIDVSRITACHWLLLKLAGSVPDDLISQCRQWLGQGRALEVAQAVTYAAVSQSLRLATDDVLLLAELLTADGLDTSTLFMVDTTEVEPMPMHGFAPTRERVDLDMGVAADRQPGMSMISAAPEDDIDAAAVFSLASHPAVRAMWRTWRFPGDGAPWPRPRRIYLLETDQAANLVRVTAEVQHVLTQAGEPDPQVEVYPMRAHLPDYQRLARAFGALMWTRGPHPGVQVARAFDGVGEQGPWMAPDHAILTGDAALRLLDYLIRGEPILVTATLLDDVVDPTRGPVVPMNLFTDGYWVWSDASVYYLDHYELAPPKALTAHIQARGYRMPLVDGAAAFRALAATHQHEEEMWRHGR